MFFLNQNYISVCFVHLLEHQALCFCQKETLFLLDFVKSLVYIDAPQFKFILPTRTADNINNVNVVFSQKKNGLCMPNNHSEFKIPFKFDGL